MSSYVTKRITVFPDSCIWHHRTENGTSSAGEFFTNEGSYKIPNIWDNDADTYARIIDYNSPSKVWGVAAFRLNTSQIPANARPTTVTIKAHINYGSTLWAEYYSASSLYSYAPTFNEAIKTKPTLGFSSNEYSSVTADINANWENYQRACKNGTAHLVFRLCCGSNLDTYRRFNDLYTEWSYRIYSFTISSDTVEGGTSYGAGVFEDGKSCTLTAVPDDDYEFVYWDNGEDANPYTFTVVGDMTITPIFRKKKKQITVVSDNTQYGQVFGSGSYEIGSSVTISATPNDGYRFSHWQDGNTNSLRSITVSSDMTYTAYFVSAAPKIHSVQISPNPADIGQGFLIAVEVT